MKRALVSGIIALGTFAWTQPSKAQRNANAIKFHHELRGTIVQVDKGRNEFTIETYHKKTVECIINSKTVLKNSTGKRIKFADLRPGDRAYCHCQQMGDGKHYSVYLLVATKNVKEAP